MMQLRLLCAILVLSTFAPLSAQNEAEANGLRLEAFRAADGLRLRWFASDPYVWAIGRREGYRLERRIVEPTGGTSEWTPLPTDPLREASVDRWREVVAADSLALIYPSVTYDAEGAIDYLNEDLNDRELAATIRNRNDAYLFVLMATDLSYPAARAAALGYTDTGALPGIRYAYRVRIPNTDYQSNELRKPAGRPEVLQPIQALRAEFADRVARLSWPAYPFRYRSFDVYRRVGEDAAWSLINPYRLQVTGDLTDEMIFTDTLPDNRTAYAYRVVGHNRFGIASLPSNEVTGTGAAPNPLPQLNAYGREDGYRRARIDWEYRDGDSTAIESVEVFRSYAHDGGRIRIAGPLNRTVRSWTDTLQEDDQYYTVRAYDRRGNYRSSLAVHVLGSDTIAPPPPTGLAGRIDTSGRVTIAWEPSTAPDVTGYRVFYSNNPAREGRRRTAVLELRPEYVDTLPAIRQLPDTVYYRVVALDERENVSDFSEVLALPVPDLNPPDPPRLRTFTADTNGVTLTYAASSSEDVVTYLLQRRAWGTDYWAELDRIEPAAAVDTYTDTNARSKLKMEYRLVAIDEAGLRAYSNTLVARRVPRNVYPAVSALEGEALRSESRVRLQWVYPNDPEIRQYRILRALPGAPLTTYRTLAVAEVDRREADRPDRPAQWRFFDEELSRDTTYRYAVQPIYFSGALGRLGETVEVNY
jgi:hypothetical protein